MSYILQPIIKCDRCLFRFLPSYENSPSGDGKTRTDAKHVRAEAEIAGWKQVQASVLGMSRKGKADLCPKCKLKL